MRYNCINEGSQLSLPLEEGEGVENHQVRWRGQTRSSHMRSMSMSDGSAGRSAIRDNGERHFAWSHRSKTLFESMPPQTDASDASMITVKPAAGD